MTILARLLMAQVKLYWVMRKWLTNFSFFARKRAFEAKHFVLRQSAECSAFWGILRLTVGSFFASVMVAVFLLLLEPKLLPLYKKWKLSVPPESDYVAFLAAIGSIGGVFIGLYYAGINTVGSAIYARVPNDLRGLLAQERLGSVYMRFLSFLTFLCLVLIALRFSQAKPLYTAIPLVTVFAGVGIFAFVKLGQRAFNLFDPTALSYHIFETMQRTLKNVRAGGFRWLDSSFQHHAYKQASASLDTLEILTEVTVKETHLNGEPFINLVKNVVRFLVFYERAKRRIPRESYWYEQIYRHRDWYRTEDFRLTVAHKTGTGIEPEVSRNYEWVEDRLFKIVEACVEKNVEENRARKISGLMDAIGIYLSELAKEGRVPVAFERLSAVGKKILISAAGRPVNSLQESELLALAAVSEAVAGWAISVALSYNGALKSISRSEVDKRTRRIKWGDRRSLYSEGFPTYCLAQLEWLAPKVSFELEVEGRSVSPLWYQSELISKPEAEYFVANTQALVQGAIAMFSSMLTIADKADHPWLSAALISREWEYWHKVEHHAQSWEEKWHDLSGNLKIKGLPWPEFNFSTLQSEVGKRRKELLKAMSKRQAASSMQAWPPGFPDYGGQFLHTIGETVVEALLANDADLLAEIFRPYLVGCVLRFDRLRPKDGADHAAQRELKIAAAALLDLIDASGYAKLMAEYHGNERLWKEVTDPWDRYLASYDDGAIVKLLQAAIAISDVAFEMPHRSAIRFNWQQAINNMLSSLGRREVEWADIWRIETRIDHESPLVRVCAANTMGLAFDGIDIFIEEYIRLQSGEENYEPSSARRDLRGALRRELEATARLQDDGGRV